MEAAEDAAAIAEDGTNGAVERVEGGESGEKWRVGYDNMFGSHPVGDRDTFFCEFDSTTIV